MRLDVYTPSGTQSGAETTDVKRSGNVAPSSVARPAARGEAEYGPWLKERPVVSSMGMLMRELHSIKTDDPQAFAALTATIGQELHNLAAQEPAESGEQLTAMAERFERASSQGDLSPFRSDPHPYGQVLRGPWAYRQTSELQEVRADVQAIIGRVLDSYANVDSSGQTESSHNHDAADTSAPQRRSGDENKTLVTVG